MSEQPQTHYEYSDRSTELRDGAQLDFHIQSDHVRSYQEGKELAATEATRDQEIELRLDQQVGQAAMKVVDLRDKYREDFELAA